MLEPGSRSYFEKSDNADPQYEHWRALEHEWDSLTIRRLTNIGVASGWRCIDVGAGLGSIAHWLAERVGSTGHVVAADLNPRYLDPGRRANFEVRKHDITCDDFEEDTYDLIHCRSLLIHVGNASIAIKRMMRALRPGGWLLVEESCGHARADPSHPRAAFFDSINQRFWQGLEATFGIRGSFGLCLRRLLVAAGLCHIDGEMVGRLHLGNRELSPFITLANVVRAPFVAAGILTETELDECIALYQNAEFSYVAGQMAGAWGAKPISSSR